MGGIKMSDEFNLRCDGNSTQNEMMRCGGDGTFSNRDYNRPHLNYNTEFGNCNNQNILLRQLKTKLEEVQMYQAQPVKTGKIMEVINWANGIEQDTDSKQLRKDNKSRS